MRHNKKIGQEKLYAYANSADQKIINYSYDNDEYLTAAGDLSLEYNPVTGQLTKTKLGQVKDFYYYNNLGELKRYVAKHGLAIIYEYELERDAAGRIIKKSETLNNILSIFQYSYDSAGRLIQVIKNDIIDSVYTYDSNGNRIGGSIHGENVTASYDEQDRLVNYNGKSHQYNTNGDLLSKGNENFEYDVFGNLKQRMNGTNILSYESDALQRRSTRVVNGVVTTKYVYSPEGKLIGQLDGSGMLLKTFVYATKSHVPDYYLDQNNKMFRIITDQLGSVRLVISNSGRVLQMMEHDEFGKVVQDSRPGFLPFGFAGGIYEKITGLVRFGVRDYDPSTGRWLSKDPIGFAGGDSNLYGYVMSDPINLIDPSGLTAQDVLNAIAYVSQQTGIPMASFGFGTSSGSLGTAIPFLNHMQVSSRYAGQLSSDQLRALLGTVYHEMTHIQDGTWTSLNNSEERHNQIENDAFNFSLKNKKDFINFNKSQQCK